MMASDYETNTVRGIEKSGIFVVTPSESCRKQCKSRILIPVLCYHLVNLCNVQSYRNRRPQTNDTSRQATVSGSALRRIQARSAQSKAYNSWYKYKCQIGMDPDKHAFVQIISNDQSLLKRTPCLNAISAMLFGRD